MGPPICDGECTCSMPPPPLAAPLLASAMTSQCVCARYPALYVTCSCGCSRIYSLSQSPLLIQISSHSSLSLLSSIALARSSLDSHPFRLRLPNWPAASAVLGYIRPLARERHGTPPVYRKNTGSGPEVNRKRSGSAPGRRWFADADGLRTPRQARLQWRDCSPDRI